MTSQCNTSIQKQRACINMYCTEHFMSQRIGTVYASLSFKTGTHIWFVINVLFLFLLKNVHVHDFQECYHVERLQAVYVVFISLPFLSPSVTLSVQSIYLFSPLPKLIQTCWLLQCQFWSRKRLFAFFLSCYPCGPTAYSCFTANLHLGTFLFLSVSSYGSH